MVPPTRVKYHGRGRQRDVAPLQRGFRGFVFFLSLRYSVSASSSSRTLDIMADASSSAFSGSTYEQYVSWVRSELEKRDRVNEELTTRLLTFEQQLASARVTPPVVSAPVYVPSACKGPNPPSDPYTITIQYHSIPFSTIQYQFNTHSTK